MNLPTSRFSRRLSFDRDCAAESTCDEAAPVSVDPALNVGEIGGALRGAFRRALHVAGDFLGGGALFLNRRCDRG